MLRTMVPQPKRKQAAHAAGLVRFQYKPYRNGARKAPASAPQLMPISCAMNVMFPLYWMMAIKAEMKMNTTISTRMLRSCFFSLMSFTILSLRKSIVSVELEAMTREESVDMLAESTRMTASAITTSDSPESIVGMMASYPSAAILT